jgi:hypothetical protein
MLLTNGTATDIAPTAPTAPVAHSRYRRELLAGLACPSLLESPMVILETATKSDEYSAVGWQCLAMAC